MLKLLDCLHATAFCGCVLRNIVSTFSNISPYSLLTCNGNVHVQYRHSMCMPVSIGSTLACHAYSNGLDRDGCCSSLHPSLNKVFVGVLTGKAKEMQFDSSLCNSPQIAGRKELHVCLFPRALADAAEFLAYL